MRISLLLASLLWVGCSSEADSDPSYWNEEPGTDANAENPDGSTPTSDAGSDSADDASQTDSSVAPDSSDASEASAPVTTVAVSHQREVRGAWVATVSRINWPSSTDASAQQAEMETILDAVKNAGLNTVFFQVRPEADALYDSDLEPWSRYLTGTQGQDPGYDPLTFTIEACHDRGLELHAWLNPYRARAGNVGVSASNHVINQMPDSVVSYGNLRWLDPGDPNAFDHTLAVIEDILSRYDIDGLHFDDYFYPYPESGLTFDDDDTYAAYGNGMSLADWRRDNVNRMVEAVGEKVRTLRPDVRWGISPFGIYRPGNPPGVVGLDQYESLYADPLAWLQGGWLEYVAPQLYWPTTSSGQPYEALVSWWDEQAAAAGRMLLVGNSASGGFSNNEYRAEMNAVRNAYSGATRGAIWWSVGPIVANTDGLASMLATEYYARPSASPPILDATSAAPEFPVLQVDQGNAQIVSAPDGIRFWAVYRQVGSEWDLDRLVPSSTGELTLTEGLWAVSAIDRSGLESLGVVVEGFGDEPDAGPSGASCTHSFGGVYVHGGCSPSYQCCDGSWLARGTCGACVCEEETGQVGCGA